jgi:hypothetical protein
MPRALIPEANDMGRASRAKRERRLGRTFEPAPTRPSEQNETGIVLPPEGGDAPTAIPSVSDYLLDLVQPLVGEVSSLVAWQSAIVFAAIAWNLSCLPPRKREQAILGMFPMVPDQENEVMEVFRDLMRAFIEQKLLDHPDDPRMIVDWEVKKTRRRIWVKVICETCGEAEGALSPWR